jgi:hypothetical protein
MRPNTANHNNIAHVSELVYVEGYTSIAWAIRVKLVTR